MRKRNHYAIQLRPSAEPFRLSRAAFYARLGVRVIYRPDPLRRPKLARVAPGFVAWVESGELRIKRREPWQFWRAMLASKIRTNAQIIEQLAILAVWTPWASELERQREAAMQYAD